MATIGITGGSGFVGGALATALQRNGDEVVIFSRNPKGRSGFAHFAHWDAKKAQIDTEALQKLDAVIHLAGAGVADKRWTAARKKEIYDSRISGTRFLVDALRKSAPNCKTFVSASAIGYYGTNSAGDPLFTEVAPPALGFLGETCRDWEAEANQAGDFCRTVLVRTGIVLGKGGGAFPQLTQSFPVRVVPVLGSGRQLVSWIHLDDLVGIYLFALQNTAVAGPYNAVAPQPVAHRSLQSALAKAKGGPFLKVWVPAFLLKALMGEMSIEVLKSCGVDSGKIAAAGYSFQFKKISEAAKDLVKP